MALARTPVSGTKEIAATNIPERVHEVFSTLTGVSIKAKESNAAEVHIGPSTVGATSYALVAGESLEFDIVDIAQVWVYGKEKDKVEFFGLEP